MEQSFVARVVAIAGVCGLIAACSGGSGDDPLGSDPSGDGAPTISGTPPSSTIPGSLYLFRPSANDPDGSRLTFNIENLPRWATFDAASGQLRGTPAVADVGSYPDIRISVTDGTSTASLHPFAISVVQSGNGTTLITWTPPTTFVDGSVLTNIAGYRVYYGRGDGNFSNQVTISNGGIASHMIENLTPGTWHFVVTVLTTDGEESEFSEPATKQIS